MRRIAFTVIALSLAASCASPQTQKAGTVLSQAAQVACKSQADINRIGAIGALVGQPEVAAVAAAASAVAGASCVWQNAG